MKKLNGKLAGAIVKDYSNQAQVESDFIIINFRKCWLYDISAYDKWVLINGTQHHIDYYTTKKDIHKMFRDLEKMVLEHLGK